MKAGRLNRDAERRAKVRGRRKEIEITCFNCECTENFYALNGAYGAGWWHDSQAGWLCPNCQGER